MDIQVFKRRIFPGGKYVFCANNFVWAYENKKILQEPNSKWWTAIDEKESISELVPSIKEGIEKIFPNGKHISFRFSLAEGRKMIQIPFDNHILATAEDLSDDEFEAFLKICTEEFKNWKG
jgi:hypothetical protein